MELGLAGRVALVCGSTKGLGRAVAKALAQEGARVAVNGRHQDSVERVAQQLEAETSRTVVPLVADVGIPAEAEGMVERVARELGRLDILFCNASGPPAAPFSHQTGDAFHRAVELNLLSTVHLARAAVPVMRKVQWGRIICLASVAAKQPVPGLIPPPRRAPACSASPRRSPTRWPRRGSRSTWCAPDSSPPNGSRSSPRRGRSGSTAAPRK